MTLADVVKIIDASDLDYRTVEGTIPEGTEEQLMDVAKKCHDEMRKKTDRVITIMHADDCDNRTGRLSAGVESVAKKIGKPVRK